ncbi:MAG: hypothetical protein U5L03_10650 [Burkholderiaceae bacterium]|nr:hypothetical protein [Burkholderiaceae bacterium]
MASQSTAAAAPVRVSLRRAAGAQARQAMLDSWLATVPAAPRAVIAEGTFADFAVPDDVTVARVAAGCVCCVGLVPLRVTLTRLLRTVRPRALLLLVATDDHLPRLRAMLAAGELGAVTLDEAA